MAVHLMGVHLIGVHLTGVYLMGVYFMSERLTGVCLMGHRKVVRTFRRSNVYSSNSFAFKLLSFSPMTYMMGDIA